MSVKAQSRNGAIDILRTLGTLMVILAHVNAPNSIQFIRSFDVCLLVMISGYCCSVKNESYFAYARKRIKRLAVPSWATMTIIFVLGTLLCVFARREYLFSLKQIAETYLFIGGREGGIGLFWIVRIYLLMSLVAPLVYRLNEKVRGKLCFTALSVGIVLINELLFQLLWGLHLVLDFVLENFVLSTLAYAAVYLIGMRLKSEKKDTLSVFAVFGVAAVITQAYIRMKTGGYVVADFKYPPQLSYMAYGIAGSLLLFAIVNFMFRITKKARTPYCVLWFSKNSFNIYLAHAVVLKLLSWGDSIISKFAVLKLWYVIYIIVISVSCLSVWMIQWIVSKKKYPEGK